MACKCGEIQLAFRPLYSVGQTSKTICNSTVIVQISPISIHNVVSPSAAQQPVIIIVNRRFGAATDLENVCLMVQFDQSFRKEIIPVNDRHVDMFILRIVHCALLDDSLGFL